jgi:hypothetical protein
MKIILYILNILKNKKAIILFISSLFFFSGIFSFFFGVFTLPTPSGSIGFYRMEPTTSFEVFYIFVSVLISALIVTLIFYKEEKTEITNTEVTEMSNIKKIGNRFSIFGVAAGIFGSVCPVCLGINFLLFGNIFTAQLSFLIPYIFWIQLGGIMFLLIGLFFVAKNSYEKKCITCPTDNNDKNEEKENFRMFKNSRFLYEKDNKINFTTKILAVFAVALLSFQIFTLFTVDATQNKANILTTVKGEKVDISAVIEEVTPKSGFTIGAKWNGIVSKMIDYGALDPQKLENILTKRYGQEMKQQWREVLSGENANLKINSDNAVFMMYLLWVLAKHNNNQILHDSPFAQSFNNYDIGVGRSGYGDTELLLLTSAQQKLVKEVAENAYRPCCGNSTARPDCSHGFSALGLIQLMASQDFSKEEIFDAFVKFNSFWFPETYIKDALYFKITDGKKWSEVDKNLIAGMDYSSLSGSYKVKNYLKQNFGI